MTNEEATKLLSEYQKWRKGKGKKYAQAGMPFDPKELTESIDKVLEMVKTHIDDNVFFPLYQLAQCGLNALKPTSLHTEEFVSVMKKLRPRFRDLLKQMDTIITKATNESTLQNRR